MSTKEAKCWFCRTDEEFTLYATAAEAKVAAEKELEWQRSMADDGWSDEVKSICWGEVYEVATQCKVQELCTDEDCENDDHWHGDDFDVYCEYELMAPGAEVPK